MKPRIGLPFRYGQQMENNTKYLLGLSDAEELKSIGVVPIDWRYKLTDEKEEDVFKHADPTYRKYVGDEYILKEMNAFLKSQSVKLGNNFTEIKKIEDVTPEMFENYKTAHNKDLTSVAENIYKVSIEKTMPEAIDDYLDKVDGIYVPGSSVDLDAKYCVDVPTKFAQDTRREKFERELVKRAIERGIPVLGICAGSWLVATCFEGGKTKVLGEEAIKLHFQGGTTVIDETTVQSMRIAVHQAEVAPGTMLHGIVKNAEEWRSKPGQEKTIEHKQKDKSDTTKKDVSEDVLRMGVNSTHWRAVVAQGTEGEAASKIDTNGMLVISAVEPGNKSIEAFENKFGVPVLGIQFHPEYRIPVLVTKNKITPDPEYPANRRIVQSFAQCAKTYANKKALMDQVRNQKLPLRPFFEGDNKEADTPVQFHVRKEVTPRIKGGSG